MTRTLLVLALIAFVAIALLGMRSAWTRRLREQAHIAEPHALAAADAVAGPWSGTYLGAVFAERWLDRVTVHTLGARGVAEVSLTIDGVNISRSGERSFSIPKADVVAVRADKGLAGRAYEDGGIVVITFRLGDTPVDIGFRFPSTEDHLAALAALAPEVTS